MSIKVSVFSQNNGDGSVSVIWRRGVFDPDTLIAEQEDKGYDDYEAYGMLDDIDIIEFKDEDELQRILGRLVC